MNEDTLSELKASDRQKIMVGILELADTFSPHSTSQRFLVGVVKLLRTAGKKEAETWAHLLAGLDDDGESGEIVPEGTNPIPEGWKPG